MATLDAKTLDSPDETRTFEHGKVEVVTVGDASVGRAVFQPGWRWSNDVKPIVGTESCQANHLGYVISGRLRSCTTMGARQRRTGIGVRDRPRTRRLGCR